jgi:hypothetical protein
MFTPRRAALVLAMLLLGCGATPSRVLAPPTSSPPSARDVVMALSMYDDVVPADPSCASVADEGATLGAIEAHLLGQIADAQRDGDTARLIVICEGEHMPWSCTFGARVEAEDPWDYRITFMVDSDGAIDETTIRCPGTG